MPALASAFHRHPAQGDPRRITADGETADCQSTGVLWRRVSPLLRIAIRVSDGKQLRRLKAMIEEG
ncbi:hypothetical protein [Candidatus Poriferisodalis sp.]|uniref:hypothetical protein n=1 Tax=Candidatus Poriferisodalis sp. TaxID=3101277 RepID=UPI003B5CE038